MPVSIEKPDIEASAPSPTISTNSDHGVPLESSKVPPAKDSEEPALIRVLSRASRTPDTLEASPAPDGGVVAWTQVLMGHLVIFSTWGYINSFGVFQTYYSTKLGRPPSDISWVGSVQIFLLFAIGTFSGRATDAGLFKQIFCLGAIIQLLGIFMTSLCTEYWQLLLAQGICTGIGSGLLFCPTISLVATYFQHKRALALSIVACGSSTGGMVFPGIIEALLPHVGFAWTLRAIGLLMFVISVLTGIFTRSRLPPRRAGSIIELAAFRETRYSLFAIGAFLMFLGLYPAFYYVGAYGSAVLHLVQADSINLLLIMNGVGIVSRILPGYIADRCTGPINLLIPAALATGAVLYAWTTVHNRAGLFVFACVYGVPASLLQGVFPAALSSLTTDLKKMGVRMGMVFSIISIASLTGSPIAGALIQQDAGRYLYAQIFCGTTMILSASILAAARLASTGWKLRVKV